MGYSRAYFLRSVLFIYCFITIYNDCNLTRTEKARSAGLGDVSTKSANSGGFERRKTRSTRSFGRTKNTRCYFYDYIDDNVSCTPVRTIVTVFMETTHTSCRCRERRGASWRSIYGRYGETRARTILFFSARGDGRRLISGPLILAYTVFATCVHAKSENPRKT